MRKRLVGLVAVMAVCICFIAVSFAFTIDKTKGRTEVSSKSPDSSSVKNNAILRAESLYDTLGLAAKGLGKEVFLKAWQGFAALNSKGVIKKNILTIADMSQPSCNKRLYIIDLSTNKLLVNTLVAHGRNSGGSMATQFSNVSESLQTSLGFYITGTTYQGGNGYSMRLQGLEKGFNDRAESRAIVMHGAPYVNEEVAKTGRIGRSWGCPAVSQKEHRTIINLVKNGSCLFIFAPEKQYLAKSELARGNDQL